MNTSKEYYQDNRIRRKQIFVDIMGGCCQLCGYNYSLQALEFHHIDPQIKQFQISDNLLRDIKMVYEELQKCILVCANCHREIHTHFNDYHLVSSYNQEKALYYLQEEEKYQLQHLHTEIKYCPVCGKIIHSMRDKYCSISCAHIVQQHCNIPSQQELKQMIRTMPFTQIGKYFSVSDSAVRKWCDKYKLPRTKKEINLYTDEEWTQL